MITGLVCLSAGHSLVVVSVVVGDLVQSSARSCKEVPQQAQGGLSTPPRGFLLIFSVTKYHPQTSATIRRSLCSFCKN